MDRALDHVEELFRKGDSRGAHAELRRFVERFAPQPLADRIAALDAVVARMNHPRARVGAAFAMAGGAMIESGEVPAMPLARGIVEPLTRSLVAAKRFLDLAEGMPAADDGVPFFDKVIGPESLDQIAEKDYEALDSYIALEIWYRPAVAAWTRETSVLREVQKHVAFRADLRVLGSACPGSHWLSILAEALFDAPFVFLFPETSEAWAAKLDGVVDSGQLSVLLADPLKEALTRIGAPEQPSPAVVAVMRGDGPQELPGQGFRAEFHLYSWRAANPETGMPQDGRFEWLAPGRRGNHSLPADFLVGTIDELRGMRVLVAVGPKAPGGKRVERELNSVRLFSGLAARVTDVRQLTSKEARTWFDAVRMALSS